jgi:arylsulfatase A-like enzyme
MFWLALFAGLSGLRAGKAQGRLPGTARPNIILIVADDLGYGDFSCYGATRIATPEVDSLAAAGVRYTRAYAASSLCSPSRYAILTGRYPWRTRLTHGVLTFFARPLIADTTATIATLLRRAGYYTACVGKWHLGFDWALRDDAPADPLKNVFNSWSIRSQDAIDFSRPVTGGPLSHGFDYYYGIAGSLNMLPFVYLSGTHVVEAPRDSAMKVHPYDEKSLAAPDWDPSLVNQVLTRKAVGVIDRHFSEKDGRPLFLYFPTSAIHQACLPTFTRGKSTAGLRGDMVEEFDWSVRQVVEALKRNHAWSNTLLIVTSDNGPRPGDPVRTIRRYSNPRSPMHAYYLDYFAGDTPAYRNPYGNKAWQEGWLTYGHRAAGDLRGFKADAWEGGLRVPLIAAWPGHLRGGETCSRLVCLSDLLATFAEITGQRPDAGAGPDSYSFYGTLTGKHGTAERTSAVLTAGATGALVVRRGGWLLIQPADSAWTGQQTYYPGGPSITRWQLYRVKKDPGERDNLYGKKPRRAALLKKTIKKVKQDAHIEDS